MFIKIGSYYSGCILDFNKFSHACSIFTENGTKTRIYLKDNTHIDASVNVDEVFQVIQQYEFPNKFKEEISK